ncbi:inorganic phosphate transporter [Candidatus Venteria ishoeyi]|uniref:Phosphate transporter n=1 Tax=Candidatus Venteria ishoeyi TaxID=1899563 RepID=A0A1H6F9Y0_9GAMM|nr:inorganic phosphate transporter [Candidatus Venteria ishoeyi]MDM8547452.1 inorganic phosphate transporter [Candidatus Venteria ishoeyi]SEH06181.1 Sulfate permease CysP [Candidatus Venteria ishoeyi]
MEAKVINKLSNKAIKQSRTDFFKLGAGLLFMTLVLIFTYLNKGHIPQVTFLAIAAMVGGYMAMNIGANDVANNVGPAVGSKALTMTGAIILAIIFESAGALIAGGDVVSTIKKGIISPDMIDNSTIFIRAMLAALLGGAIWLNIATAVSAPVSTTHSIVGGVMGAGIMAAGWNIVNWKTMGMIASSWVISPILGGIIAALFLYAIKVNIFHQQDMVAAARRFVPVLLAVMGFAFVTYLAMKGIKKIIKLDMLTALMLGAGTGAVTYFLTRPIITKAATTLKNERKEINTLFTIPMIFAAALLSFAHGANDVANAIGPLAAINDALMTGEVAKKASIPLWIMLVGALGIALGLALYGPKLIRTVGSEITELDQARAWSIAMASAIVVIIASWLGLPVSSTHIAIGGVFGVGFLRMYLCSGYEHSMEEIKKMHIQQQEEECDKLQAKINAETDPQILKQLCMALEDKQDALEDALNNKLEYSKKECKQIAKIEKDRCLKKDMLLKIVAAWLITVPVSGILAASIYFIMDKAL